MCSIVACILSAGRTCWRDVAGTLEATLTRPFGQIRLYTDDLDWLPEPVVDLTQIRAEVAFSHIFTMDVTVDLLRRYFTNGKQSSGSIL